MTIFSQIKILVKHEWQLEMRQKSLFGGVFLHIFSAVFICYMSLVVVNKPTWNALFWIIVVFSTLQAIGKSFIQVRHGRWLYYYQTVQPGALILAKIIYNNLVMIVLLTLAYLIYGFFMHNEVFEPMAYYFSLALCGSGISAIYTMVSAISAKTGNANMVMPVLSLPLLIPMLITGISASKKCMDGILSATLYKEWAVLFLLNLMVVSMAFILFRYLWKE